MNKIYGGLILVIGILAGFALGNLWENNKTSFSFNWSGRKAFFIQPKENIVVIKTEFGYFHLSSLTGHVDLRYKNKDGYPLIHFFHDLGEYYPKYLTRLIEVDGEIKLVAYDRHGEIFGEKGILIDDN